MSRLTPWFMVYVFAVGLSCGFLGGVYAGSGCVAAVQEQILAEQQ